ncbi:hypothetical protein J8TS2_35540 [Lederbergia ruris]|uniref:NADH dehydrogenase subunit 1 n=1 Tax=Lederbergia ruris TaxID=217495 RepID=A0ABQ4KMT6_9BACI|nr:hypothetical protein J8TS2_35540 [Lederbergia ruris]
MVKIKKLENLIEEIILILGLILIIVATAMLSIVAAIYVTGLILFLFGFLLAYTKKERR